MGTMKIWDGTTWQLVAQNGPAGPPGVGIPHAATHYAGGTDPITGALPLKVGAANVIVGQGAAGALTTGDYNTALGLESLKLDSTGAGNVGIGYLAGDTVSTGDNNIAIGNQADAVSGATSRAVAIGSSSLAAANGVAVGSGTNAGYSGSVAIGRDDIGASAAATAANDFRLGTDRHKVYVPGELWPNNGIGYLSLNMQTGLSSVTTNGSGDWTCVFGRAFSSTPYFVIPVDQNGNHYVHSLTGINTTVATFRSTQLFNGVVVNTALVVRWIAFGPK